MSEAIRLSKRLVELLGCSRREAELYIEGGWVTVDGVVVDTPQFMVQAQQVELLPGAVAAPSDPVTLLLNQPPAQHSEQALGLITPESLWAEQASDVRTLKSHFARQQTCLPLQAGASGLLVFTQDWRTLRKLNDDAAKLEQEYIVEVIGQIATDGLKRLGQVQTIRGEVLPKVKASWQNETHLRIALKNPGPAIIVRLCDSVGLKVTAMKRIRIGGVAMGKLPVGQWRYLGTNERF